MLRNFSSKFDNFCNLGLKVTYSSLSNNCAVELNVQAGKFSKINNCADCNKCAGWKISYSYQMCRLENLQKFTSLAEWNNHGEKKICSFLAEAFINFCNFSDQH